MSTMSNSIADSATPVPDLKLDSLNNDPFNLRAERLAMEECMLGLDVTDVWSEVKMVHSFVGTICPATPDGMFEERNGRLTCVQVVRVPFTTKMMSAQQEQIIYRTVLAKIVKSQQWMMATRIVPHEFNIFCWCQGWPETAGDLVQGLMDRVRKDGWPFTLKLCVPAEPGELFPVKFAYDSAGRQGGRHALKFKYTEDDLSTYAADDFVSDDEWEPEFSLF